MTKYDEIYAAVCNKILEQGTSDRGRNVRAVWASDKTPAFSHYMRKATMLFDGSEVPLLSQKYVAHKTAIIEGLKWIWQMKSNDVNELNKMGVHIWDNWKQPDGTIGKAYGYQLAKKEGKVEVTLKLMNMLATGFLSGAEFRTIDGKEYAFLDQVDYLLYKLKTDPASRRHITMLWNWDDMKDMALTPCVYETQWTVEDDKLHLEVGIRSNDICVGNPFNVYQYYLIWRCIGQVTGYKLGELEFNIKTPHIYDRHIENLTHQLSLPRHKAPTLHINPNVKSFYDFDLDDFTLEGYEQGDGWEQKIWYEIAE